MSSSVSAHREGTRPGAAGADVSVDIAQRVRSAVAAAEDRKAVGLRVLRLDEVSDFTDYFIVCSGTNQRQVHAIVEGIDKSLRTNGLRPLHQEGHREGQWVLLDYGDFVAHVFDEERRDYYRLERLWSDAPDVTPEFSSLPSEDGEPDAAE